MGSAEENAYFCKNCTDPVKKGETLCNSCLKILQHEVDRVRSNTTKPSYGSLTCPHCEEGPDRCYCGD